MTRCLGLDIGDRKIGVALSDPQGILATPFTIIDRKGSEVDIGAIIDMVSQHQVGRIIVGLPRSMDGSLGKQAEKVEAFANQLRSRIEVPLDFRDERLSTVTAKRLMRAGGAKKHREKVHDDAAAAAVILQGYLDEEH